MQPFAGRRVDADNPALCVDHRTAAAAWRQVSVRFDHVFDNPTGRRAHAPAHAGDNAGGDGGFTTAGTADEYHHFTELQSVGIAESRCGQLPGLNTKHGQVGFSVHSDDRGLVLGAIAEESENRGGSIDNVRARDDRSVRIEHHTRPRASEVGPAAVRGCG